MGEKTNKFVNYIEQLLPFLEASPTWFKIWIYVLIFLIGITVACAVVFYLSSKQEQKVKSSLNCFSIEHPRNNDELPLGKSKSWLMRGQFPVVEDSELGKTANVQVEVFKLPDNREIPQTGEPRISTVRGVWTFEFVKFVDEGDYDVVASGFLGSQNVWERIKVQCVGEAQAMQNAIERSRLIRGVPKLVMPSKAQLDLPKTKQRIHQMETEFFEKYGAGDLHSATDIISNAFNLLDSALVLHPDDSYLQGARAYFYKNYAMVMHRLGQGDKVKMALDEAEKMFESILGQKPRDAGAWNGLGSVASLRGDYRGALYYIDRSLEINPNYKEALHDRDLVLKHLAEQNAK